MTVMNPRTINISDNKVCIISDIHIGIHQNSFEWVSVLSEWAVWLSTELDNGGVHNIIICGDVFHYRDTIAVNILHSTSQIFKILSKFNITIIVGNHDAYYKDKSSINSISILGGWNNITIVDVSTYVNVYGKKLGFIPWGEEQVDDCDILFGHFEIVGFKMNTFKICDNGMSSKYLLSKSPLTFTGHFHTRDEKKFKSGDIIYTGNPFEMDFGDLGNTKGFYLLDIQKSVYEFIPNIISPLHKIVKLSTLVEIGKIDNYVRTIFKNNIVKLVVDMNISIEDYGVLMTILHSLSPRSISTDYDVAFNNIIPSGIDQDLSTVKMDQAISEFVNTLNVSDDRKNKVIQHTLDLYYKCRTV